MEATSQGASRWVTAAVPLSVALGAIGAVTLLGRPTLEALIAGAVVGLTAALVLSRHHELRSRAPLDTATQPVGVESLKGLTTFVADLMPDALVLYTDDGKIAYANM